MASAADWHQALLWREVMAVRLKLAETALGEAVDGAPPSVERLAAYRALGETRDALRKARDGASECRRRVAGG